MDCDQEDYTHKCSNSPKQRPGSDSLLPNTSQTKLKQQVARTDFAAMAPRCTACGCLLQGRADLIQRTPEVSEEVVWSADKQVRSLGLGWFQLPCTFMMETSYHGIHHDLRVSSAFLPEPGTTNSCDASPNFLHGIDCTLTFGFWIPKREKMVHPKSFHGKYGNVTATREPPGQSTLLKRGD